MSAALSPPEMVIGLLPVILILAVLVRRRVPPQYDFTDSGRKFRKVDAPTHASLLTAPMFWLLFCAVMASAATWALWNALVSAVQSGSVSLPGVRNHPRPTVSWQAAWSYFLGAICLLVAGVTPWVGRSGSGTRFWMVVASVVAGIAGWALVLISPLLSSWRGVGFLATLVACGLAYRWWRRRSSRTEIAATDHGV